MASINLPQRLGGITEVAAELGVTRQQVANLREREDFPAPVARLSATDVWDLDAVKRWDSSGLRRSAGRPSKDTPRVVGRRFQLGNTIETGGFAVVYRARDLSAGEDDESTAAVKVLQQDQALEPGVVERFSRELDIMSRLRHSNVMPILDGGTDEQLGPWYAMPLARRSLKEEIGVVDDLGEIVSILRDICSGLAYIHSKGILHRDLKPSNVLRRKGRWKLADFGLARDLGDPSTRLTETFDGMGSQFYMAPEQWEDAKHVDERADIYAVGKIMQALVSGTAPVTSRVPPGKLRSVIERAIEHEPDARYGSAEELLDAIETATAPAPSGEWETPEEKTARLRPRLEGGQDTAALEELINWSNELDADDSNEAGEYVWTMSALPTALIKSWSKRNPGAFKRAFREYTKLIQRSFPFGRCDELADFVRRVVATDKGNELLSDAVCGLAVLGRYNNRWHVRDVAVAILQEIRTHEDAGRALEGLRRAGVDAAEWTLGATTVRTLHPTLRSGIQQFLKAD